MESLGVMAVLELIEPAGESGNYLKHHPPCYKPGEEAQLRRDYKRLELLAQALGQSRKPGEQLHSALAELPRLPHTLKALEERTLLISELFEIKKLVHYARLTQKLCRKLHLDKVYPFPELDNLYALLDPDQTNSPAFALSAGFDTRLARYLSQMSDLQQEIRKEQHLLLQAAQSADKIAHPKTEIVVSRHQKNEVKVLQNSAYYRLADENFANLTFRLKDSPRLASLAKQSTLLKQKLSVLEEDIITKLSKKLKNFARILNQTAALAETLDWDLAKAQFMLRYQCCLPAISAKAQFSARQAVNLPLKLSLESDGRRYQPLDLGFNTAINVITGPNMGGKTTVLKTVGQFCLLTRLAIPLPAAEAELCLFDRVWYNREAEHGENLSSFGHEIVSLKTVLEKNGKNLYLLDEIARGTNPREGEALLVAVLQYLSSRDCLTLAATHFDKPARLEKAAQYAIRGIDAKALDKLAKAGKSSLEEQLDLLNQLLDYKPIRLNLKIKPPRNAIPIASALGLPEEIIRLAEELANQ